MASIKGRFESIDYPKRDIRIVLPFQPGGAASGIAGAFAEELGRSLGRRIVLENVPGDGTAKGTAVVANSEPDGHTLLVTNTAIVIAESLMPKLPYDTLKDLAAISTLSSSERVLAVHPSVPATNLQELVAYAKKNPAKLNVCCFGTSNHLENVLFMLATDTVLTVAPYVGGGTADHDFLEGIKLQMVFNTVSRFAPHIKAGRLRGIAYTGKVRDQRIPEVPTFTEAGLNFSAANWYMLLAPAAVPKPVLQKLNDHVLAAQAAAGLRERLYKEGVEAYSNDLERTSALLSSQLVNFAKAVKGGSNTACCL